MNVNYIGSLAERRLKFSSTVSVQSVENSDLFNSVSVYVPRSFAAANIVDFDVAQVTADEPAILAITVDNYIEEIRGDLLAQLQPIFRDDTNSDVTILLVVFYDLDTVPTYWAKGTKFIEFEPLTKAFRALYFLSYLKLLYDPTYDGEDVAIPGTKATLGLTFTNDGAVDKVLAAGAYSFIAGTKTFAFSVAADQTVAPDATYTPVAAEASVVGTTTLAVAAVIPTADISPSIDTDFDVTVATVVNGTAASSRASTYFDMALAMAYLTKSNPKLSVFWSIVRIDFDKIDFDAETDTNKCLIRTKNLAAQQAAITNIATGDLAKYFYGALRLMEARGTSVLVDCEDRNPWALVLKEWFAARNSSGEFVGNKLSMLRITAQRCFGPVSNINSNYNAGDPDGYDIFDEMNVGCFVPISSSASGDSYLSMCRDVMGFPINALMISKFADYTSGQNCADMITDKGTLTNPVLTNEEAYKKIQNIVIGNIARFSGTKRIVGIVSKFPAFNIAKTGLTALEASSAWSATYIDDLDEVTISGGITAE